MTPGLIMNTGAAAIAETHATSADPSSRGNRQLVVISSSGKPREVPADRPLFKQIGTTTVPASKPVTLASNPRTSGQ